MTMLKRYERSGEQQVNYHLLESQVKELEKMDEDIHKEAEAGLRDFFASTGYTRTSEMEACVRSVLKYQIGVLYNQRNKYFTPFYDASSLPVPYQFDSVGKYLYFLRNKVLETGQPKVYLGEKHREYVQEHYQ